MGERGSPVSDKGFRMIVGVTGGGGFIGAYVLQELRARGHEPLVLDHKRRKTTDMLGDVRDETIVQELAAHVDGIIHLAAVLGTSETIDNPTPAAATNIIGTLNVFEAGARYGIPVVFAAVGNSGIGRGAYCITKTCGEQFVDMYREDRGAKIASVRPMNAYGPGQSAPAPYGSSKVRKITPSFICAALSGDPMRLYGGGEQVSDMVWVGDAARVFVTTLEALRQGSVIRFPVDVGSPAPVTVREVAETVARYVPGATMESVPMRPGEPEGGPLSTHRDVLRLAFDIMKERPGLEWSAVERAVKTLGTVVSADTSTLDQVGISAGEFMPLDDGIQRTVDWYRQNKGVTWSPA